MSDQFEFVALTGQVLSPAEQSALVCTLPILADEYKKQVQFWGKVKGLSGDYLIVQATADDLLAAPTTLYSMDAGLGWNLLHGVDEEKAALCADIVGCFRGDPSFEYRVEVGEHAEVVPVRESERLAHFVATCDFHCAVIPRGAFMYTERGTVTRNRTFQGLDADAAGRMHSYLHRRHLDKESLPLLYQEHLDKSLDFMPGIHTDIPQGVWVLKCEPALGLVYGQSLLFRGAVFYHRPGTPVFGYCYLGNGEHNRDLPFML
eukprot:TRINITY_DN36379_c0_g1_i1.p1 TRINITY_DN36379_c0_g1~~TRINITY_DN36379_c0_g1_i1.p1  ORF type:complete len:261 (+),score=80.00 TRINITY_DN36379_c0_g1_i1:158-940(+)